MDSGRLIGSEIHGFHTLQDLDVPTIMKEARSRWLRPNEIHAILCNHRYFTINVKPINLPQSGTIILFDRKMLRNFRKDGHNWKKKNDGKTVKEAHEHLKVGNEERIHVYYAHGLDKPTFVRRCYWLLDKNLENIVLVHYRETNELQGSPATPLTSYSSTALDPSTNWILPEELDSGAGNAYHAGSGDSISIRNYEQKIHEINTLDWDELVANDPNELTTLREDKVASFDHHVQSSFSGSKTNGSPFSTDNKSALIACFGDVPEALCQNNNVINYTNNAHIQKVGDPLNSEVQSRESIAASLVDSFDNVASDGLCSQESFGRWMNCIIADTPSPVDNTLLDSSISSGQASFSSALVDYQTTSCPDILFRVTDISPAWAFSTEETKILITGHFHEEYQHLAKSDLFCVCGDACIRTEIVQVGVYRCLVKPHDPGMVNLYMSTDCSRPISQVLNFEYRAPLPQYPVIPLLDNKSPSKEFQVQMRLAHLMFSTSKCIDFASMKVSAAALKEAKKFAHKASLDVSNNWSYIMKSFVDEKAAAPQARDVLFELTLKNKLIEWLLERIIEGCKTTEHDAQGQGVIHLCAILGYTWAVRIYSWSGLSLDFRDRHGWTALHWAAYCGREKMAAALLSAGAKPYLVTDSTSENPGGCTAGDLASKQGYHGLGAYLSENSLVEHLKQIVISGNASESLLQYSTETEEEQQENLPEDELCLKDTLAAYRKAADAAARIQSAFRERSLKLRTKAVESFSPEIEARNIVAAMKIQHAFRKYESHKKMAAAARIQHRFRTWKLRQEFLNMRRHTIRIQAAFRGFQARRQYLKIIWSVGVLEKAILRWRLRRKGFRGLKVDSSTEDTAERQHSDAEEDFFRASRKQAEERVERSVVRVQAMFRSKKAQEEYRRMKLAHAQAKLEYGEFLNPSEEMDV